MEVFWTKRSSEQEQIWDKRSKLQKPSPRSIIVVTFTFPSRPENVLHCPPLSEGEGLACRVLQVNPFIIHIIMFYTCVFVFDLIMCNVYCMYSYLILHLPILQLYIYTFIFFLCIHVCICSPEEVVKTLPPQLTPAKFLAPVLLEVPHFSPIGEERWLASVPSTSSSSVTIIIINIPLPFPSLCHFNFSRK